VLGSDADAPVRLPEISVRTGSERVAAFKRATGGSAGREPADEAAAETLDEAAVPLTYPFCWLTLAEVRPTLERMIGRPEFLPVHEAQSFDYEHPLALDADYRLAFTFRRTAEPARLTVNAEISTPHAQTCARFETVLRLVRTGAHD
jgi:hypothetical protein